jgi:putative DNA methylase
MTRVPYPRRLIEVDLPIRAISAHARREKSIRHGHISTLHIWWARRPLAACRAVICAALWPDPADELCPQPFREAAADALVAFAELVRSDRQLAALCADHWPRWNRTNDVTMRPGDTACWPDMRYALLDFIADFASWDASTVPAFLDTARHLTQAAHEALGGEPGTRPLVVDPFAGGGSIPLEALRVGADAFASDLNPVAVLLNKVVLEYIPKYGQRLADEVRKWGQWVKEQAEAELAQFYPKDPDGATPIAYLWARTIRCEGPGCGAEVPLMRSLWLAKKERRSVALRIIVREGGDTAGRSAIDGRWVDFEIISAAAVKDVAAGTVRRGAGTCPVCGYTTPVTSVRAQLRTRRGGAADARLFCVVTTRPGEQGRHYRAPTDRDSAAVRLASGALAVQAIRSSGPLDLVPTETISLNEIRRISVPLYGMTTWGDLFTHRQALALTTLARLISAAGELASAGDTGEFGLAVLSCLALTFDRVADLSNALCGWKLDVQCPTHLFARQAVPMMWDFSESVCLSESSGSWMVMTQRFADIMAAIGSDWSIGTVTAASATKHPLPADAADLVFTDPPYYDAVPYAHLSDFFYVWMRRILADRHGGLFLDEEAPKQNEVVVDRPHELSTSLKNVEYYESELTRAFAECRRVLQPQAIGTVVFASKTTASWEAILQAIVASGWIITASWPVDTEMETRVAAIGQARLASSIHLVCRPREDAAGNLRDDVGDWRDVLAELPGRIHDWMPRLASEGVVGADAIFACLGPALEIFSRYARVEKVNGEQVALREYLEHVWAAVSREALGLIFEDADATGFEEDARLTAMWLWTLNAGSSAGGSSGAGVAGAASGGAADSEDVEDEAEDAAAPGRGGKLSGYVLEFDAARKIAQGLGAHLEELAGLVQVKGDKARLVPVRERMRVLFGKEGVADAAPAGKGRRRQLALFEGDGLPAGDGGTGARRAEVADLQGTPAATTLDRVHQAMLLFAFGTGDQVRRFLVDEGVGAEGRFWRLAQALSALYPPQSEEKRWVDGVLARKKALGYD